MNTVELAILWVYGAIVAVWVLRHVVYTWIAAQFHVLTPRSPRCDAAPLPRVLAIIPAKDEEAMLAGCLESVCAQGYPNLEILVVDDRSTDRTRAIAEEFAHRDPRVRVLAIEDLPAGWTGKTHALHTATQDVGADWLWFVDADTRHHPDALAIVLEYARREGAALATLMPELRCETFWEKALQPLEGIVLMRSYSPLWVNNDRSTAAFANGQFLLVERSAYEAAGGHAAVRDRFVEDIYMSINIKCLGRPVRVAIGTEISSTRMYTSLPQIVRGWARILYDALGRRTLPLLWKIVEPFIFSQTGEIALAVALVLLALGHATPFAWWLLGLSVLHQVLKTWMLYRMYRLTSPRTAGYAGWYPVAGVVSAWISLVAIWSCLTGRVTWRGTSYRPAGRGTAQRAAAASASTSAESLP